MGEELLDLKVWKEGDSFVVYEALTDKHRKFDSVQQILYFIEDVLDDEGEISA